MTGKKIPQEQISNLDSLLGSPPVLENDIDNMSLPPSRAGLFFSMTDFCKEIRRFKTMDVMTFSCFEPEKSFPRITRLIHNRETTYIFSRVDSRRVCTNLHAKIYLCRDEHDNLQGYIGSANWMPRGEFVEVMIRVNKTQSRELLRFFNKVWKLLERR